MGLAWFGVVGCALACGHDSEPWEGADDDVIRVEALGAGCFRVTYAVDPAWECSEDQIEIATPSEGDDGGAYDGGYDGGTGGATVLPPLFDDVKEQNVDLDVRDCGDLVDTRRDAIRRQRVAALEAGYRRELASCLPTERVALFQNGAEVDFCTDPDNEFFDGYYDGGYYPGSGGAAAGAGGSSSTGGALGVDSGDGASEYSETNNQVAGVEEADYVKNDAGHVFLLTAGGLEVFDSWPVPEMTRIASLTFDGEPRRLLLAGDQLVVFLRKGAYVDPYTGSTGQNPSSQGCTYGYDCRFQSEGGSTEIEVYDVSNPAAPVFQKSFELSGGYVASRRIGDDVHVVVHDRSDPTWIPIDFAEDWASPTSGEAARARRAELLLELERAVNDLDDDALLPRFTDGSAEAPCDDYLEAPNATGTDLVTLASFRLSDLESLRRTTLATAPGFVYASADALYVATDGIGGQELGYYYADATNDASVIHKFALGSGRSVYRGSAPVRGHVLNQFSMDEKDGVLRVATTSGWVPDPDVSSTVTTFRQTDAGFRRYGELTGLAPTEDIRSVRFDGDRGFVVTFKKTDPLFVFGLSDPSEPVVLGELKIPGFSTYMHPLDQDHLLAIGFDADDHGDFAYFDGIQVQIFDVSDLENPLLLHKKVIGTRGSGSEALLNHLAFNYFAPQKTLALPITICEGGDDGNYGSTMSFQGVLALSIDLEAGIDERGRLPFAQPDTGYNDEYATWGGDGCFQWWSSSTSNVKRSMFFDDYLVGLSDSEIRAAHLDALSDVLVSIPVGPAAN